MPKPIRPPKPPKPVMRWGVYNKRGILIGLRELRYQAQAFAQVGNGEHIQRVMVTPIASRRAK